MITKISPTKEQQHEEWNKVYFLFPTTLWIDNIAYRIFKDWAWRKGKAHCDMGGGNYWDWKYSLTDPKLDLKSKHNKDKE